MLNRSVLSAGIACAAAGVLAFTPAVAPQLTDHQQKVVAATEAHVKLAALSLTDLINTYFGVDPAPADPNIPPVTGAPGTSGATGVLYQLLYAQQGNYLPGQLTLGSYFNNGLADVIKLYLLANNSDPVQRQGINDFFNGGATQLAYNYLASGTTNPDTLGYLGAFFNINNPNGDWDENDNNTGVSSTPGVYGASGLVYQWLSQQGLSDDQQLVVDDFFYGGVTDVVWDQLLARLPADENNPQTKFVNDFFNGGVTQNVRTALLAATQDPQQRADIAAFFPDADTGYEGGLSENFRMRLLGATSDPNQKNIINEFFDNGVAGVARYLLVGPAPTAPQPAARTTTFAAVPESVSVSEPTEAKPETPEPQRLSTAATPAAVTGGGQLEPSAPEPQAAPADPAPDVRPAFTARIRDKSDDETKDAVPEDGGANFNAPLIIEGTGERKDGEGSWGVFGQVADAIGKTIAGAGGNTAPAGGGSAGGDTGGGAS